ncbi:MAG: twin-arginine translocase subunit TatC [Deltaproteobacteria bacterium]|nr:twin-arginine translocase subunit TatC [Deltaproteobacteria bacterium]
MNNPTNEKMPFTSHLEELRGRLIRIFIAIGILFVVCYFFKEKLFEVLTIPLVVSMPDNSTMIFTSLPEAFFTYLKVSFFAAIFLASPYILYQIWKFISPGLYESEKKYVFPFVFFSTIFFVGGSLFAYFVVFPFGFKFFLAFGTELIRPMLSIKEFLSFSFKLLLAFGIIFELPILMFFLSRVGLINSKTLITNRKYAILVVFIVAALFTPPDVVTQVLMALPLMFLYEASVWVVRLGEKKAACEEEVPQD